MTHVDVTVTDGLLAALKKAPHEVAAELRLAAAIHWYQQSLLSMERAAETAGMTRAEFLAELARRRVDVFVVDDRISPESWGMPDALLVVNASPLIFLGNAGHLELLHTLGARRIIVPEPVFDEVMSGGYTDKAARVVSDATWLEKRPSPSIPESVVAWEIGKGESSVIATALHEPGARVVIDDLNGRKCALAHELDVVGTLGVVIAAHSSPAITYWPKRDLRAGTVKARRPRARAGGAKRRALHGAEHRSNIDCVMASACNVVLTRQETSK